MSAPRWPWRDRDGRFSPLKASALLVAVYPALWSAFHLWTGGFGPLPLVGLVYWSGVWATALLLLTLAVTPLGRLLDWRRLVVVRRILGVSALFYTLAHVAVWGALYRWDGLAMLGELTRPSLVVASVATAVLLALGATSFDAAIRVMGGRTWKRLHRANYAASTLAVAHFLLSPGIFALQFVMAGILLWLLAWRAIAALDRAGAATAPRLWALAAATWAATVVGEAAWRQAYHQEPFARTIGDNLTLAYGVSAGWWVLAAAGCSASVPALIRHLAGYRSSQAD